MNKPLSIDELKALKVGDWVWVEDLNDGEKSYYKFFGIEDCAVIFNGGAVRWNIKHYGTDWLAYKNKEYAEAKGEIVELPCIRPIERKAGKLYEVVYVQLGGMVGNETYFNKFDAERRLAELRGELMN